MEVYRIQRASKGVALSGIGAARMGGRWNSVGTEVIYTSENRSLAQAEVVVHCSLGTLPSGYNLLEIFIPEETSIVIYEEKNLPAHWNIHPPPRANSSIGDNFIREGRYCLLKIPSAVTQGDYNILINPTHPEFVNIQVVRYSPFPFDARLFLRL